MNEHFDGRIRLTPIEGTVTVLVDGREVARSNAALLLEERGLPPRRYLPLAAFDAALLSPSDRTTYCPWKGDASYRGLPGRPDVLWVYEDPREEMAAIAGYASLDEGQEGVAVRVG